MKKSEIQSKIINMLSNILDLNFEIKDSMNLRDDLGMDSLDQLIVVQEIENMFSIQFSKDEIIEALECTRGTVRGLIDYVDNFLNGFPENIAG